MRAREKEDRQAAAGGARRAAVRDVAALVDDSVRRFNGIAGQPRSFDRARSRCSTSSRTGSRTGASRPRRSTTGGSSTSTSWRRCGWKIRRSSTRCTASCSSWSARRGHRPAHRSRRRPVRAGRLPAPAAGASCRGAGTTRRSPSSSSSKKSSARASSCRATGRCTARPATSSPPIVNNLFVDRRNERALDDIYTARSSRERARAAVVRRSGLSQQEAGAARDDVGRHQLARPSAESLLRAQPSFPRLHALQPDLDAQGSDRLLPGLPHLHHRGPTRSASTTAATSSQAVQCGEAAGAGDDRRWCSTSSSGCCSSRRR